MESSKHNNPFKTPPHYFEGLDDKMHQRIQSSQSNSTFAIWSWKLTTAISTAALVIIIAVIYYLPTQPQVDCNTLACIDDQTLIEEAYYYDADLIIEFAGDTKTETLTEFDEELLEYMDF